MENKYREYVLEALNGLSLSEISSTPNWSKFYDPSRVEVYDEADDETFYGYCKDELKSFVYRVYGEMDDLGDDIYLNAITTGVINQYSFMPKPVVPDKFILDESNGKLLREEWYNKHGELSSPSYRDYADDDGWPAVIEYDTNIDRGCIAKVEWYKDGEFVKKKETQYREFTSLDKSRPSRWLRETWYLDDIFSYNGEQRRDMIFPATYLTARQMLSIYARHHGIKTHPNAVSLEELKELGSFLSEEDNSKKKKSKKKQKSKLSKD